MRCFSELSSSWFFSKHLTQILSDKNILVNSLPFRVQFLNSNVIIVIVAWVSFLMYAYVHVCNRALIWKLD